MIMDIYAVRLENEIHNFRCTGPGASLYPIFNTLRAAVSDGGQLIVPTKPPEIIRYSSDRAIHPGDKVRFTFLHFKSKEEGKFFLPLFTSPEEMNKGQSVSSIRRPVKEMIDIALKDENCSGLVINNFGERFAMTRELLETFNKYKPRPVVGIVKGDMFSLAVDVTGDDLPINGEKADVAAVRTRIFNLLDEARGSGLKSAAFPGAPAGKNDEETAKLILSSVAGWIKAHPGAVMNIYLCCPDDESAKAYQGILKGGLAKAASKAPPGTGIPS